MSGTQDSCGLGQGNDQEKSMTCSEFRAEMDGQPVTGIDVFCADPLPPGYEINFDLPQGKAGNHVLQIDLGSGTFGKLDLEVVGRISAKPLSENADSYAHCCLLSVAVQSHSRQNR